MNNCFYQSFYLHPLFIIAIAPAVCVKLRIADVEVLRYPEKQRNVLLTVFWDGHDTVGFQIHSFSAFERIKKYDENEDAGNVGKPYSIEARDMERTITIYMALLQRDLI